MMTITDTKIILKEIKSFAYHGVLPHEHRTGNTYYTTLEVLSPAPQAMQTDRLEQTINYADLYTLVQEEMERSSELIEHVVYRILERVGAEFPTVTQASVTVCKRTPPIPRFDAEGVAFSATARYDNSSIPTSHTK